MKTIPITAPAAPGYIFDRERPLSFLAGFASTGVMIGRIVLALPLFGLAAFVFALHLIFPSEEHW